MKLTSFLLLFSSAFAVKVTQIDTMGGIAPEEVELAETEATACPITMPTDFISTVYVSGGKRDNEKTLLKIYEILFPKKQNAQAQNMSR